jgi:hypothetical protein
MKEMKMSEVIEQLERLRVGPIRTPEEAEVAGEASRILGELLSLERRASLFVKESKTGKELSGPLAGLTLHEAARRVLHDVGTPLHAKELGARIKARGWRHPRTDHAKADQIVFQLAARLPRHPETFRRVGPNTFALVEWGPEPFRAKRRTPRFGLFAGSGKAIGRLSGESEEAIREGGTWRSS